MYNVSYAVGTFSGPRYQQLCINCTRS